MQVCIMIVLFIYIMLYLSGQQYVVTSRAPTCRTTHPIGISSTTILLTISLMWNDPYLNFFVTNYLVLNNIINNNRRAPHRPSDQVQLRLPQLWIDDHIYMPSSLRASVSTWSRLLLIFSITQVRLEANLDINGNSHAGEIFP